MEVESEKAPVQEQQVLVQEGIKEPGQELQVVQEEIKEPTQEQQEVEDETEAVKQDVEMKEEEVPERFEPEDMLSAEEEKQLSERFPNARYRDNANAPTVTKYKIKWEGKVCNSTFISS